MPTAIKQINDLLLGQARLETQLAQTNERVANLLRELSDQRIEFYALTKIVAAGFAARGDSMTAEDIRRLVRR